MTFSLVNTTLLGNKTPSKELSFRNN